MYDWLRRFCLFQFGIKLVKLVGEINFLALRLRPENSILVFFVAHQAPFADAGHRVDRESVLCVLWCSHLPFNPMPMA